MMEQPATPRLGGSLSRYKLLGTSGLRVSPLCFGCMHLADPSMTDKATARRLLERYIECGGNFFDTSPLDERGMSETWIGEFLMAQRSRCVIATKFGGCTDPKDPNSGGIHRKNLVQSLDASLRRLGTPYVDLLLVHIWEARTPVEEVMRALDDIVRSGKALYVGIANSPAWKVSQANTLAQLRGLSSFVGMQTQYSLVERTAERDILPMCHDLGIGCLPWGVLSQGIAPTHLHLPISPVQLVSRAAHPSTHKAPPYMPSHTRPMRSALFRSLTTALSSSVLSDPLPLLSLLLSYQIPYHCSLFFCSSLPLLSSLLFWSPGLLTIALRPPCL